MKDHHPLFLMETLHCFNLYVFELHGCSSRTLSPVHLMMDTDSVTQSSPQYAFLCSLDAACFHTSPSNTCGRCKLSFHSEGQFGVTGK